MKIHFLIKIWSKKNFIKNFFFDEIFFPKKIDFFKSKMWNSNPGAAPGFKNEVFVRFYCRDQKFPFSKIFLLKAHLIVRWPKSMIN